MAFLVSTHTHTHTVPTMHLFTYLFIYLFIYSAMPHTHTLKEITRKTEKNSKKEKNYIQ